MALNGEQIAGIIKSHRRQREKDLKAYREKTQSLIEEREAAAAGANTAAALHYRETMFQRRKFRASHYTQVSKDARLEAKLRRKEADRKFLQRDAELAARQAEQEESVRISRAIEQVKGCVEIKNSRHRRDACSMAWRCRFLAARPGQVGRVIAEK